jgi:hypothetical protein
MIKVLTRSVFPLHTGGIAGSIPASPTSQSCETAAFPGVSSHRNLSLLAPLFTVCERNVTMAVRCVLDPELVASCVLGASQPRQTIPALATLRRVAGAVCAIVERYFERRLEALDQSDASATSWSGRARITASQAPGRRGSGSPQGHAHCRRRRVDSGLSGAGCQPPQSPRLS